MQTLIYNASLVLAERLIEHGWLLIENNSIADLGELATCPNPNTLSASIDAAGNFLMPGLIDLHCDAIEKLVEPRPKIHFDLDIALREADWRLAGCGITTEFHAVTLDDNEFGVRSDTFVLELLQAIQDLHGNDRAMRPLARHKIHARLELTSRRSLHVLTQMIAKKNAASNDEWSKEPGLVSLMDHSPGQGQYTTEQAYRDYIVRTTNRTDAEVDEILALKRSQVPEIPRRIESITQLARAAGVAIATHDDDTANKVEQWATLGVALSEFPTTLEAAKRAHELGLAVCMGAPNALRGQSSGGNLSALAAIQAGIADVLCADYYPAAMLGAAFKLASQHILTLPQATRLVTLNPAKAVGLGHAFGSLEPGKIADLIIVHNRQGRPIVQRVFVDGEERVARSCI